MPAPPTIPVVHFQSPAYGDTLLSEAHNTELGSYVELPIGTPHPNVEKWPGYVLVKQQAFEGDEKWIIRYWAADPEIENTYNLARQTYSGSASAYPIYVRRYMVRRINYEPLAKLTTLSGVLYVRVTAGGSGYDSTTTVAFSGGGGSGATGVPIIFRGAVVGVRITAEGTGYTSNPTVTFSGTGSGATATAGGIRQGATAYLVDEVADRQEEAPEGGVYLQVTRVYETLPGPWIPFARHDKNLGPISGRKRAVAASGQTASLTSTVETTYEARDGSSVVLWEIEETSSNGTGGAGNPTFPVITSPIEYDEVRGSVTSTSQVVVKTGSEVGSVAISGSTVTRISYVPFDQYRMRKITETWTIPGPTIVTTRIDPESGIQIGEGRTLKEYSAITPGNTLTGASDAVRILTVTERERTGIAAILGIEVVTTYPPAAAYQTSNALEEEKIRPYTFPGRVNVSILDSYGSAVGHKKPSAELVSHTIKTWWINSSTKPTITYDEIKPNTIYANDVRYDSVLHNAFTRLYNGNSVNVGASTPDYTTFLTWIGTSKVIDGSATELRKYRWKVQTISVVMR